jgi:hypothetical protein
MLIEMYTVFAQVEIEKKEKRQSYIYGAPEDFFMKLKLFTANMPL